MMDAILDIIGMMGQTPAIANSGFTITGSQYPTIDLNQYQTGVVDIEYALKTDDSVGALMGIAGSATHWAGAFSVSAYPNSNIPPQGRCGAIYVDGVLKTTRPSLQAALSGVDFRIIKLTNISVRGNWTMGLVLNKTEAFTIASGNIRDIKIYVNGSIASHFPLNNGSLVDIIGGKTLTLY